MWIKKSQFEKLKHKLKLLQNEIIVLHIENKQLKETLSKSLDNTDKISQLSVDLSDMLTDVIDTTFEKTKFETVIFKKYNCAPQIIHKGTPIEFDKNSRVKVDFSNGETNLIITRP